MLWAKRQRLARAACAVGAQCGNPVVMPGVRLRPGLGCRRQPGGDEEGGLMPWEFPTERVPGELVPMSQEGQ